MSIKGLLVESIDAHKLDPSFAVALGDKLQLTKSHSCYRRERGAIATVCHLDSDGSFEIAFDEGGTLNMKPPLSQTLKPYGIPIEFRKIEGRE
ncbi:hypothetical protein H0262_05640 [Psychrobacter cryohalolentis]|uniref:hypothetical protein n=1 Tax=Psychrobacter sp. D2 TaxID=2759702 RepID=UPI0015E5B6A3|nr:hypothetical protein [Psychrobacter sp. D2]MBA2057364.1 hypothetical protein [Psychrobacter sp. D2]